MIKAISGGKMGFVTSERVALQRAKHRLLCSTALVVAASAFTTTSAQAACVLTPPLAVCDGDVFAGVPPLGDAFDTLIIENTTTILGGRSIIFDSNLGDLTVDADFSPFGLVNDPTGFERDDLTGIGVNAASGSADVTLIGDMTILAGSDVFETFDNVTTDHRAGVSIFATENVVLKQTGDVVVDHADLTVITEFVAGVDTERFAGIQAVSTVNGDDTPIVTVERVGSLTVDGPNMTASATDDEGSNRTILNSSAETDGRALFGILAQSGGAVSITNMGDVTVNAGDRNGTASSVGGRAETDSLSYTVSGISVPHRPNGTASTDAPDRTETVVLRQTGDVNVSSGDATLTATSETALGGSASEAVVNQPFLLRGVTI